MKVLIDTNVIVDVLQQREPWCNEGNQIFMAVACNEITGCITAKQAADIHFFSRKQFKGEENVDQKAREVISKLFSLFEVLDTLSVDCQNALGVANNDYEDAILIETALRTGADCIVTRNTADFASSQVRVLSPGDFLKLLSSEAEE